jgi:hypothetical protein
MKQTAIDWLVEQLDNTCIFSKYGFLEIIEEAKAMEKEQMGKIFKQAQKCAVKADGVYFKYESFEQLDKTFKSE